MTARLFLGCGRYEIVGVERVRLERPGDIAASYSADKLMTDKGIRDPFRFRGELWIATGTCAGGNSPPHAECYRVVAPRAFQGPFRDRGKRSEEDRRTFGPYHGDKTRHAGKDVLLQGPPVIFAPKDAITEPEEPPMTEQPPCNTPAASLEQAGLGRRCVECLGPVDTARDERKMFCSDAHRTAFHNRQTVRGRKAMPLLIAERIARGGDRRHKRAAVGIAARKRARAMIAAWVAEDKAANRMGMDEYVELRMRLGLTD